MQSILSVVYPAQCISCGELVDQNAALCVECWRETPFIHGATCRMCGVPLLGEAPGDGVARCDDCLAVERPWTSGAAALTYSGIARRLVLALKHGDRHDLIPTMARWMVAKLPPDIGCDDLIVPVPIHWRRMVMRKFNQSAMLARSIAATTKSTFLPDALIRVRHTPLQEGMTLQERFSLQSHAIRPHPRRASQVRGRRVFLIDDVMTSGATASACTNALTEAGAGSVCIVTLARVVKEF